MKKVHINAWLDALAFSLFAFIMSSGLLMYYLLPPGSGRWKQIWGWSRHDWGEFHFWVALIFLVVVMVHLVLHQKWIVNVVKGKATKTQQRRAIMAIVALVAIIGFSVAPFITGILTGTAVVY